MNRLIEAMENKHTFVLLPVPSNLAELWPKVRGGGDTTPPHFTLLFVGPCAPNAWEPLVQRLAKIAQETPPFQIKLSPGVAWFTSHDESLDNREIAHKKPDEQSSKMMGRLHQRMRAEVEKLLGHEVKHFKGPFKAHSTLRYEPKRSYNGPVPEGSWTADTIEVMGAGGKKVSLPLGG